MSSSAEYTALLGLVGAALAGTGAVVGLETIGEAVANGVRTGICIVAGDVCRASDAEAAGLAPCTMAESTRGEGLTFTVAVDPLRRGRRVDGLAPLRRHRDRHAHRRARLGGKVGIGVEASPLGLNAEMSGKLDYTLMIGAGVGVPRLGIGPALPRRPGARGPCSGDVALRRRGRRGRRRGGGRAGPVTLAGFEATARSAAGARVGRGLTTYYLRTRADAVAGGITLPGVDARIEGPSTGDSIVELTTDAAGPREIAFRTVQRGTRADQVVETVARLDLRDPGNRAAAEPLLVRAATCAAGRARGAQRDRRARGLRRDDGSEGVELSASLGVSVASTPRRPSSTGGSSPRRRGRTGRVHANVQTAV